MTGTTSLKCRSNSQLQGFALVISLSLMVLLTVLAVGLLGLSSISLRSSSRGDSMALARANARMALMIAIGELQKELGPDLRTSGTADLAGTSTGTPLSAGAAPGNNFPPGATGSSANKGLTAVQSGTRYWTGTWENTNQTNPATTIYTATPIPKHRKWLISGNEGSSVGNAVYTPASEQAAVGGSGTVTDAKKAVVLVGSGTVGDPNATTIDRYVSAPLVEISDGTSNNGPTGRHGWWIGDEGVKAKLNLASPFNSNDEATYPSLAAQRRGWDAVDGFSNYPSPGTPGEESIPKLVSVPQASLIAPALNQGSGDLKGRIFHSATTESFGVLTDSLQGGLRLDMSAYMEQGLPTSAPAGLLNGLATNTNVVPRSLSRNMKGPRWDRIKEFYDVGKDAKQAGKITVSGASNTNSGAIAPIITEVRMLLGVRLKSSGGSTYAVQPCAKIAISIANPYPYSLEWTGGLDVEVKNETDPNRYPSSIWIRANPKTPGTPAPWNGPADNPAYLTRDSSKPAVFNRAIFRIPSGSLQPGQSRAYTISDTVLRSASPVTQTVVNMGPMRSVTPGNFDKCLIVETTNTNVDFSKYNDITLDVREDTVTSQCTIELRPAGSSSTILRRLERFELDNAPFERTEKKILPNEAAGYARPLGLQYYSFQMSQPGERYESLLGDPGQLGLRSSTLRTYTDFNLQATRFRKPIISYNPPPFFMQIADSRTALGAAGDTGAEFTRNMIADPLPWGYSRLAPNRTILFSPPSELVSLGQLQHVDLTGDDLYASVGHQPGNAAGNSYASPFVPRTKTMHSRVDFNITGFNSATNSQTNYYDISYLLNASLWDTYFFSTIPGTGAPVPRNPSMVKIDPNDQSNGLQDAMEVAGHLLVNGSHNVNCTEKDAWKALLGSSKHLRHPAASGNDSDAIFPRSLEQVAVPNGQPTGMQEDSFAGYRKLNDDQLDALATELARQVRLRGPFVTMSQFVNRALVSLTQASVSDAKMLGRSGALQSAIDISGINISPDGSKNPFSSIVLSRERVNLQAETTGSPVPRADLIGTDTANMPVASDVIWPTRSWDENPGAVAGIIADKDILSRPNLRSEQGYRSTGIPGWVTQADVLQILGPVLSARSDTFRVRAYGEALDPATGTPVARAWCEAIVQRMPDYIDGSDKITDRPSDLTPVNARFGRRFKTVSFKWLSPDEI